MRLPIFLIVLLIVLSSHGDTNQAKLFPATPLDQNVLKWDRQHQAESIADQAPYPVNTHH